MHKAKRRFSRQLFMGVIACIVNGLIAAPALADDWPTQPIRLVSPFPAGGTADILSRVLGKELSEQWQQPTVVENKAGAGGAVAASQVARAKADGYTMMMVSGSMLTVNPNLYENLPYRVSDFKNASIVSIGPMVVAASKNIPVKNLAELLAYIRQNKTKVNFGSSGIGSQTHMATEMLMHATNSKMTHIPYSGETPALSDLIAGQIQIVTANLSAAMPFIASGKVNPIAVTSRDRTSVLPEVPTVAEQLHQDFDAQGWFGIVVPKDTPDAIVRKIESGIQTAISSDTIKRKFQSLGLTAATQGHVYMTDRIKSESAVWKEIIKDQAIKPM